MRIDVVTIFPSIITGGLSEGIPARAAAKGIVDLNVHNLRDFTDDRHRTVDDTPYGGGPGMVMKPEPFFRAVAAIREQAWSEPVDGTTVTGQAAGGQPAAGQGAGPAAPRIILLDPQGPVLNQAKARELAQAQHLILLCGRYEGVDERVRTHLATEELSIGDYVLSGGEIAALVVIDAVVRLLPGAVGTPASVEQESFADGLLEGPHYTRPRTFQGVSVPPVLLSGDHEAIRRWRRRQALLRTRARRPDLLAAARLTPEDLALLAQADAEGGADGEGDGKSG